LVGPASGPRPPSAPASRPSGYSTPVKGAFSLIGPQQRRRQHAEGLSCFSTLAYAPAAARGRKGLASGSGGGRVTDDGVGRHESRGLGRPESTDGTEEKG